MEIREDDLVKFEDLHSMLTEISQPHAFTLIKGITKVRQKIVPILYRLLTIFPSYACSGNFSIQPFTDQLHHYSW